MYFLPVSTRHSTLPSTDDLQYPPDEAFPENECEVTSEEIAEGERYLQANLETPEEFSDENPFESEDVSSPIRNVKRRRDEEEERLLEGSPRKRIRL